jgi:hypothetical protein
MNQKENKAIRTVTQLGPCEECGMAIANYDPATMRAQCGHVLSKAIRSPEEIEAAIEASIGEKS